MKKNIPTFPLTPILKIMLNRYREDRAFDPKRYLDIKLNLLYQYFNQTNLRAAIIGISGGIDSSVTLAILKSLQKMNSSPLKKIIPICLPFYNCEGATGQIDAASKAKKIVEYLGLNLEHVLIDLGPIHKKIYELISAYFDFNTSSWSQGQLVSNLRTPVLYQIANQLNEIGFPCAVIGTINRDEGSFIGFFGKASDAMVDIQIISDLHKSEIKKLASFLNIPKEIINAQPTGNTYDGNTDELSFNFSYDFLELYSFYLNLKVEDKEKFLKELDNNSARVFEFYEEKLLKRHQVNIHKYFVGPQGLHFDVYPKAVNGGWNDNFPPKNSLNLTTFQSLFVLDNNFFNIYWANSEIGTNKTMLFPDVSIFENALTQNETNALVSIFNKQKKSYAGSNGYPSLYGKQLRATTYNPLLATLLFNRMNKLFDRFLTDDGYLPIDGGKNTVWRLKGFSPVFRFIAYETEGELIGHYDEAYVDGSEKTLFSIIFYLTSQGEGSGGETVILLDRERNKPLSERLFIDDTEPVDPNEILQVICPKAGNALMLAHRIKHAVLPNKSKDFRIILRADLVYERLGPYYGFLSDKMKDYMTLNEHECLQDVFYRSYYLKTRSHEKIIKAGYIEQTKVSDHLNRQTSWSILPLIKLYNELASLSEKKQELVVLLSTGGFCPIHKEHFMMMSKAKFALEEQNKKVIAGFFSPSHLNYIKSKHHTDNYSTKKHIQSLCNAVAEDSWLDVWLWEYLEHNNPINFTDVILRLETELARYIKTTTPIKVAYVFGGDNASFAYAFIERGLAVCISRPGAEEVFTQVKNDPLLIGKSNIFFIENEYPLSLSSEKIRKNTPFKKNKPCHAFYLRDDNICYQHWQKEIPKVDFFGKKSSFMEQLAFLFNTVYRQQMCDFTLKITSSCKQIPIIEKTLSSKTILSLDPCYKAQFNLGISRYFRFGVPEIQLGYIARPESATLKQQIDLLPKQAYCLVDDDSHSGKTIEFVKQLLAERHSINEVYVFTRCVENKNIEEIGDIRDFIVGSHQGGLVVLLPNKKIARVPYIYPFVLPSQRYHCPSESNLNFSRQVWQLNRDFFSDDAKNILIKHCDSAFINLTHYLGFPDNYSLYDFCDFHIQQLNKL